MWPRILTFLAMLALALFATPGAASAQGTIRDDFEGPETSLRDAGGDATYKIESQLRVQQGAHSGTWCEQATVSGNNGTYVYLAHPVRPARIISELAATLWLKSDRPGLRLLVRVVLPRTNDPKTGKPLTTLVRGGVSTEYRQAGSWQQLRLDGLPLLVDRQVRVLRTQFGRQVDAREAYLDLVVINAYGGPGVTHLSVDDLELTGVVAPEAAGVAAVEEASAPSVTQAAALSVAAASSLPGAQVPKQPRTFATLSATTPVQPVNRVPTVELSGPVLLLDGRPFLVRAIEYRGEPLARLKALGFNAARLTQVPTPALLAEATTVGLWLVAPPPPARDLEPHSGGAVKIPSSFDPVLAWDLGSGLGVRQDLEATRAWAKLLQAADSRDRPIFCDPETDLRSYSRPPIKLLLARRDPLGSTLSLAKYGPWLEERSQLALGGTPLWATIQTDFPPALIEQMQQISGGQMAPVVLQDAQIRGMVRAALASKARGLCFTSHSRLDATDPVTRRRAAMLELINLELDLAEPWPASGRFSPDAQSNDPHYAGAVIMTERSRLLLPYYAPPGSQCVLGATNLKLLTFTVTGVPEGDDAYELSATSLRRLSLQRVAGGHLVVLKEEERESLVVLTRDPVVIKELKQRQAKIRDRAVQLTREVAGDELSLIDSTEQRLAALGRAIPATAKLRSEADAQLKQCDTMLKGDPAGAYYQVRRAQQTLRVIQRAHWDNAVPKNVFPLADPFTATFASLPEHYRLAHDLANASRSGNRLAEGGFEDLSRMMNTGWKHFQHRQEPAAPPRQDKGDKKDGPPKEAITTSVELTPQAAHSGSLGLRLKAVPTDAKNPPAIVETPPVWITSAGVHVEQGDLVEIQGWLRIPQEISGNVDGLLIIDSLGGEPLALRAKGPEEWRAFTLLRYAARRGPMSVTFALAGLGEAWLDDVTIQIVSRGRATPPPQSQAVAAPTRPTPR